MSTSPYPAFRAPDPSRATRKVPIRSLTSNRSTTVGKLPGQNQPCAFFLESKIEQTCFYSAASSPDVYDIWDQPPAISFIDTWGKERFHTFDFLITLRCGRRIAVIVKPVCRTHRRAFQDDVRRIAEATPITFADRVVVFTDRSLTKAEAVTARRIFSAQQNCDPAMDRKVWGAAKAISHPQTIRSFLERIGVAGHGYRSVLRAIGKGVLHLEDKQAVSPDSLIVAGGGS